MSPKQLMTAPALGGLCVVLVAAVLGSGTTSALAATGELIQKPGIAGCVSEFGSGGTCTDGRGLAFTGRATPSGVAVSPDGRNVYVAAGGVVVFDRDPTTGSLAQKPGSAGCLGGGFGDGCGGFPRGGGFTNAVAVSPDGKNVYLGSAFSEAVAILDRDPRSGELAQKPGPAGCIQTPGFDATCTAGRGLIGVRSVTLSADGKNLYATASASGVQGVVTVFDRDTNTGTLTQKPGDVGCISAEAWHSDCGDGKALDSAAFLAVSPDGRSAYVASPGSGALAVFDRDPTGVLQQKSSTAGCVSEDGSGGQCGIGRAFAPAVEVLISPDGRFVYVASGANSVAVFERGANGVLTQRAGLVGCVSEDGSGGVCTDAKALIGAASLALSPDARNLYVGSVRSTALAVFDRDAATGALSQKPGLAGCVSQNDVADGCAPGRAIDGVVSLAVSPNGRNLYTASAFSGAVGIFDRATASPPSQPPHDVPAPPVGSPPNCRAAGTVKLGSDSNDVLVGTAARDVIFGLGGDDRLRGLAGRDCLLGGHGNDRLFGGRGRDRLFGGRDDDRLSGGRGGDRLRDGRGHDRFRGGTGNDRINARDESHHGRERDFVRCGSGKRDVAVVDSRDRVAEDCERVTPD